MPVFLLRIRADLENIAELVPLEGNLWKFDISSGGEVKEGITVSSEDVIELAGSKGEANFVCKFPGATTQSYIKIVDVKKVSGKYTSADAARGDFTPILGLECRGLEIDRWIPSLDFEAFGLEGTRFESVDLSDLTDGWCEYDEKNNEAVSIQNLQHEIKK